MGLDMYLNRTIKLENLAANDYNSMSLYLQRRTSEQERSDYQQTP